MEHFTELKEVKNISIALGFFDGVHLGHQSVIKNAVDTAKKNNTKSAVITFKRHPNETFGNNNLKYITTRTKRSVLIANLGIDYLFELDFSNKLSNLSGEEYLENIIIKYFSPISISTGYNHTFGYKKSGNSELLAKCQKKFSYIYNQIPLQKIDNIIISSTKIKEFLSNGKLENANKMLGYSFTISGNIIHGDSIGHSIGYPTANLNYPESIIELPYGVYSTKINKIKSITNYGTKPTISENNKPVLETHILNFNKNIYNTNIEIEFIKKIRNEKKFDSIDQLKAQISKDISEC